MTRCQAHYRFVQPFCCCGTTVQESRRGLEQQHREIRIGDSKVIVSNVQRNPDGQQLGIHCVDFMSGVTQPARNTACVRYDL